MSYKKSESRKRADKTNEARGQLVVKGNALIQKARYQLTLQEQKIVLYMISRIKPNDDDFIYQEFSVAEFCRICGMDSDNGGNYKYVKETIKDLADKSAWITIERDGKKCETLIRWIEKAWIEENTGFIQIRLDKDLKPYLLQLRKSFTQYELIYTLAMRSQYSVRIYELLKSYQHLGFVEFNLDDLKRMVNAENYIRGNDFRRRVIETSLHEINALTDIYVEFEFLKTSYTFTHIKFIIKRKENVEERLEVIGNISKRVKGVKDFRKE